MEREAPRRRRESSEAVVHPAGEPPLERRVAGMPRKHGLGRRQPREKELERAGPLAGRIGQTNAACPQPVARDLVDEDGIEVVHRRVPVAAEGGCRDEGERRGDACQSVLEALVERRAPEGVPPAVAVVEMRMHEPLGNRAARQLDDREDPACAVSERERGGGRLREPKELADVDPPGRHLGARDLGASRQTDANLVVRERAGGVAGERERAGVLLPDELEGRRGRFRIRHDLPE